MPIEIQIKRIFKDDAKIAKAVFTAESGLRCEAVGDGHLAYKKGGEEYGRSYGIAQIRYLPGRPSPKRLTDCTDNLLIARELQLKQGWGIWSAWKSGAFKKFLN